MANLIKQVSLGDSFVFTSISHGRSDGAISSVNAGFIEDFLWNNEMTPNDSKLSS